MAYPGGRRRGCRLQALRFKTDRSPASENKRTAVDGADQTAQDAEKQMNQKYDYETGS